MDKAARDALVTGYESLIRLLEFPDPDDRYVLAAAIVGRCDGIDTANLKGFGYRARARGLRLSIPMDFSAIISTWRKDYSAAASRKSVGD